MNFESSQRKFGSISWPSEISIFRLKWFNCNVVIKNHCSIFFVVISSTWRILDLLWIIGIVSNLKQANLKRKDNFHYQVDFSSFHIIILTTYKITYYYRTCESNGYQVNVIWQWMAIIIVSEYISRVPLEIQSPKISKL